MAASRPDPFATPDVPPTYRRPLAIAAFVCAVTAPWLVVTGVLGMVLGSVAHLKGDRLGMPAAVLSGITTIVAMALLFFGRG